MLLALPQIIIFKKFGIFRCAKNNKACFRCRLCGIVPSDPIQEHLMKSHMISLHDFQKEFLAPSQLFSKGSENFKLSCDVKKEVNSTEEQDTDGCSDLANDRNVTLSDNIHFMCLLQRNICGAVLKRLDHHVRFEHSLNEDEFRMLCPEKLFFRKTYHRFGFSVNYCFFPKLKISFIVITSFFSVLGIRSRMLLGLPDPDPLVRGTERIRILPFLISVEWTEIMLAK